MLTQSNKKRHRRQKYTLSLTLTPYLKEHGNAILFTLLIVTLITAMTLFMDQSITRETRISSQDLSSLGAYYAAEAGIEDGLARAEADRSIQVPTCSYGSTSTTPCGNNPNLNVQDIESAIPQSFPDRIRMATFGSEAALYNNDLNKAQENIALDPSLPLNPKDFVYDLKITSEINHFGPIGSNNLPTDPSNDPTTLIKNGDSVTFYFNTTDISQEPTTLSLVISCPGIIGCDIPGGSPHSQPRVMISQDEQVNNPQAEEGMTDVIYNDLRFYQVCASLPLPLPCGLKLNTSYGPLKSIRFTAVSADMNLGVVFLNMNNPVYFQGDVIVIQSIGHFGGITRRLEARISRDTGNLLGLFDYTVYAGNTFTP